MQGIDLNFCLGKVFTRQVEGVEVYVIGEIWLGIKENGDAISGAAWTSGLSTLLQLSKNVEQDDALEKSLSRGCIILRDQLELVFKNKDTVKAFFSSFKNTQ